MINLIRKKMQARSHPIKKGSASASLKKQRGAATLIIATILLMTATLVVLFSASFTVLRTKVAGNQLRNQQAFMAAEAGLEFGINYLQQNSATILASPVSGHIQNYTSASTTNVSLANSSKFSIVYTNPVASNYTLIQIASTGTSADGSGTRTLVQLVQTGSSLNYLSSNSLVVNGSMSLSGNSNITNTATNNTIEVASTVSISGNGQTTTSTGGSSSGHIGSDIQQNASALNGMSSNTFMQTYLGSLTSSSFAHYYSNTGTTSYNSLNGLSGTTIWIDQTGGNATISGNTTIGTAANPVLLVVNGPLVISGNVTIYGFVLSAGSSSATSDLTGNVTITGGMAIGSSFSSSGNTNVNYNTSVLNSVKNLPGLSSFAKVPGSWKDF